MAWNGSNEKAGNAAAPARSTKHQARGTKHGLIAFALVALGGGLAAWLFMRPSEEPTRGTTHEARGTMIAEVKPQIATNAVETVDEPTAAAAKPEELGPQKVGETRDGKILLPSGRLHKVKGVVTNSTSSASKGAYAIFEHDSDNEIACLLTLEPGMGLVGTPRYNGDFKKDFLKSLETPIVINEDDSEEDKELKRNVRETKVEMKAALDRGEDIEQMMLDTRAEYQKLAIYKAELKRQLDELHANGEDMTVEDMANMVEAANKMLEDKGIAPLKYGPLIKQKMLMMREQAIKENN